MSDSVCYPFSTFSAAIAHYRFKHPARCRQTNIYEPDKGSTNTDREDPGDLWASIALAIARVLRLATYEESKCFTFWHITLRDTEHGKDFIARELRISERQVARNIKKLEDLIAVELIKREVLDPEHEAISSERRSLKEQQPEPITE